MNNESILQNEILRKACKHQVNIINVGVLFDNAPSGRELYVRNSIMLLFLVFSYFADMYL